jgi:RNA polymerase sigma factor (sigma-70 family)
MDTTDEKHLVARAQKDPDAFGVLFDIYYPKILNYIVRRTGDPEVGKDIVADVFYKALKNLWQFRWRSVPFGAWLYRIATNEVNQYFRKGEKRKQVSLDALMSTREFDSADQALLMEEVQHAEDVIARHKEYRLMRQHVSMLPIPYQEVLALRYFENKKLGEIAVILGKKEGTIKSLHSRALALLRAKMIPLTPESLQPFVPERVMHDEGRTVLATKES